MVGPRPLHMWFLSKLFALLGTWVLSGPKAVESIDFFDTYQVRKVTEVAIDLAQDIYCNTLEEPSCGHDFFDFMTNTRYKNGKIVKQYRATVKYRLPKILIWDWNGDKDGTGVPPTRMIVLRGTHSEEEWMGNFDCEEVSADLIGINPSIDGVFHKDFANVSWIIWKNLKQYITDSPYPVLITGHSRGGALAQMLHVIAKKNLPDNKIYTVYRSSLRHQLRHKTWLLKQQMSFVDVIDCFLGCCAHEKSCLKALLKT